MDLNIWADWWNINASVALWKESIIIESIVEWKLRVNKDFEQKNIIKTECENWKCYDTNFWTQCTINEQHHTNHKATPPCLKNISNKITNRVTEIISNYNV